MVFIAAASLYGSNGFGLILFSFCLFLLLVLYWLVSCNFDFLPLRLRPFPVKLFGN